MDKHLHYKHEADGSITVWPMVKNSDEWLQLVSGIEQFGTLAAVEEYSNGTASNEELYRLMSFYNLLSVEGTTRLSSVGCVQKYSHPYHGALILPQCERHDKYNRIHLTIFKHVTYADRCETGWTDATRNMIRHIQAQVARLPLTNEEMVFLRDYYMGMAL